ncbi:MAG: hypothetical protein C4519_24790 [Desulfobacteraceae bacterium]|nr:MAG: hypothetical protein C4519_24790 [Desulfobacteraceae bacterium]
MEMRNRKDCPRVVLIKKKDVRGDDSLHPFSTMLQYADRQKGAKPGRCSDELQWIWGVWIAPIQMLPGNREASEHSLG